MKKISLKSLLYLFMGISLLMTSIIIPLKRVYANEVNIEPITIDNYVDEKGNFDFEGWHKEAMKAHQNFISLFESRADDPTWKRVFAYAETIRSSLSHKKLYIKNVKDATEEEWNNFDMIDIIDYSTTYLNFTTLKNSSNDYYDSNIKSGETVKQKFLRSIAGANLWKGNGKEEVLKAYYTVSEYQLQYFEYYNFPYNFHNDKSYAEETGLKIDTGAKKEDNKEAISKDDFTDEELKEINEVAKELEDEVQDKEQDKGGSVALWIIPIVIVGAVAGYLVGKKKK